MITKQMAGYAEGGSLIRRMFEAGIQLKQQYGEDAVFDFSLGNPDLPPPREVAVALKAFAGTLDTPYSLGYMPNAGFGFARTALAKHLCVEQGVSLSADHVILTCGAAGGLNVFFKSVLEEGDEVIGMAPYFVEYGFYVANYGGVFTAVPTLPDTFRLDLSAIEAAITPKTRCVMINSPNNPTGTIYTKEELEALVEIVRQASKRAGRPVYLLADEPYRFLAFDGIEVPSLLAMYEYAVVASSFSKILSMAGERIGYLVLSPTMPNIAVLMGALTLANRILGFVNPPAIGQHIMTAVLGTQVDVGIYERRRQAMAKVLQDAGYEFSLPQGAFYFFPKAPGGDDVTFVKYLTEEKILAVPGKGFGCPGYFRLAFCVDEAVIARSAQGFVTARKRV